MENKQLLDELYHLTQLEEERPLTEQEVKRYLALVDILHARNVEIHFAINI